MSQMIKPWVWCQSCIAIILSMEFISAFALKLLNLNLVAYPWFAIVLLVRGFYAEVAVSTVIMMFIGILMVGFIKKGIFRYVAVIVLSIVILMLADFYLGLLLYQWYYEEEFTITTLFSFLWELQNDSVALSHMAIAQAISGLIFLFPLGFILFEKHRPANKVLGNAHFANGLEIKKEGFFKKENESIIIGKKYGAPLYSNGFEHVLVFAPSGSGKTRSIAIPNLFNYPYSVVCNDVKLTLFKTTSGYRERILGHQCYCWALTNTQGITHRFNPLTFISENKLLRITDIQRIAHILIPDNKKESPIWTKESRKLFKALVLYLLDSPDRPLTLGEVNRLVKQQKFDEWLLKILEETNHYDPEFYRNGYSYINTHIETRSSILITFSGYLELFDDPIIDAATSETDFDIRALRKEKMTIYIGFNDDDMERLSPILTLFWQQLISAMIQEIPCPIKEPYPLLCLIDEFSSLGRIERLRRSLKLLREYKVRCILLFQYIAQTYELYSHEEAKAFTNIKTKLAYGSEDNSDAELISKMLGTRTQRVVSRSVSIQSQGGVNDSKNINYQAIPLLRPDEIMRLKPSQSLIMRSGSSPIKASQFIWYKEVAMKNLPCPPTIIPQQLIQQIPFTRESKKVPPKNYDKKGKEFEYEESQDLEWIENE